MGDFIIGLIIGILGTGMLGGIFLAYYMGKNKGQEEKSDKKEELDKRNKRKIASGINQSGSEVKQVKFEVNGKTRKPKE